MNILKWNHAGLFVGGMLFATKGIELMSSKPAHDLYVKATALALRGRDGVMNSVTVVREGCEDIYAEAIEYNEDLAATPKIEVEIIEDKSKTAKKPAAKSTAKKTVKTSAKKTK